MSPAVGPAEVQQPEGPSIPPSSNNPTSALDGGPQSNTMSSQLPHRGGGLPGPPGGYPPATPMGPPSHMNHNNYKGSGSHMQSSGMTHQQMPMGPGGYSNYSGHQYMRMVAAGYGPGPYTGSYGPARSCVPNQYPAYPVGGQTYGTWANTGSPNIMQQTNSSSGGPPNVKTGSPSRSMNTSSPHPGAGTYSPRLPQHSQTVKGYPVQNSTPPNSYNGPGGQIAPPSNGPSMQVVMYPPTSVGNHSNLSQCSSSYSACGYPPPSPGSNNYPGGPIATHSMRTSVGDHNINDRGTNSIQSATSVPSCGSPVAAYGSSDSGGPAVQDESSQQSTLSQSSDRSDERQTTPKPCSYLPPGSPSASSPGNNINPSFGGVHDTPSAQFSRDIVSPNWQRTHPGVPPVPSQMMVYQTQHPQMAQQYHHNSQIPHVVGAPSHQGPYGSTATGSSSIMTANQGPSPMPDRQSKKPTTSTKSDNLARLYEMDEHPERRMWLDRLLSFMEDRGTPIIQCPTISKNPLDLYRLYIYTRERGGFMECTRNKTWKDIAAQLGIGASSSGAYTLKKHYGKNLLAYECYYDRGGIDPAPLLASVEPQTKKKAAKQSSTMPQPPPVVSPGSQDSRDSYTTSGSGGQDGSMHGAGGGSYAGGAGYGYSSAAATGPERPPSHPGYPPPGANYPNQYPAGAPRTGSGGDQYMASGGPPTSYSPHSSYPPRPAWPPHSGTLYGHPNGVPPMDPYNRGPWCPPTPSVSSLPGNGSYCARPTYPASSSQPPAAPGGPGYPYSDRYQAKAPTTVPPPLTSVTTSANLGLETITTIASVAAPALTTTVSSPLQTSVSHLHANSQFRGVLEPTGVTPDQGRPIILRANHTNDGVPLSPSPQTLRQPLIKTAPNLQSCSSIPHQDSSRNSRSPLPNENSIKPDASPPPAVISGEAEGSLQGQVTPPRQPNSYGTQRQYPPVGQPPGVWVPNRYPGPTGVNYGNDRNWAGCPRSGSHWGPDQSYGTYGPQLMSNGPGSTWQPGVKPGGGHLRPPYRMDPRVSTPPNMHIQQRPTYPGMRNREHVFPSGCVEATLPVMIKPRKYNKLDVQPVDGWRLVMALRSGLLAESTWALDVLNILLYDDNSIAYFGLSNMPGLLEIILEHWRVSLAALFETIPDNGPKHKRSRKQLKTSSSLVDLGCVNHDAIDLSDKSAILPRTDQLDYTNWSRFSSHGEDKLMVQKVDRMDELFVTDSQRSWDTDEGFFNSEGHEWWSIGETLKGSEHIVSCFPSHEKYCRIEVVDGDESKTSQVDKEDGIEVKEEHICNQNESQTETQVESEINRIKDTTGITFRDPIIVQERWKSSRLDEEVYVRDEPSLYLMSEAQNSIGSRAICISTIIRNLSFLTGNENELSRNTSFLRIAGQLLRLFQSNSPTSSDEWWWDYLHVVRENVMVTLSNIAGSIDFAPFEEEIVRPILSGLLEWAVSTSAYAQDPFPHVGTHSSVSPQRLAIETLCKMCLLESNVDLLLSTPPYEHIEQLVKFLTRKLYRCEDPILREFSINLLFYLSAADSGVARTIALADTTVSLLLGFIEQAEQNALIVAQQHGVNALRDNPESMGTSLDMLRRSASTLNNLSRHPDNLSLFMRHERRLLTLVMSQILDQGVASILANVLFHMGQHTDELKKVTSLQKEDSVSS